MSKFQIKALCAKKVPKHLLVFTPTYNMMTFVEEKTINNKNYVYLKTNYRSNGKTQSNRIYLGAPPVALRILNDLQSKDLINETELTYSGEIILEKLANSLNFESVLNKYIDDDRVSSVLKNIVILRSLFPESKRKLFNEKLDYSILKYSTDIKYMEEIYRFMDKIYSKVDDIVYELVKHAIKKYKLSLKHLIIDATRFKVYKDHETGLIEFGYSAKERKDLPQANLVMAVNNQQVPLFVKAYPGSTSDVVMFKDFIKRINVRYKFITKQIKTKFIVFDQGNVNKHTIQYIQNLKPQGIYFVSMYRSSGIQRFIDKIKGKKLDLIYTKKQSKNKITNIYGKLVKEKIYDQEFSTLVCHNDDIAVQKNKNLDRKINFIKEKLESLNSTDTPLEDKHADLSNAIKTKSLKRAIKPIKNEKTNTLELEINTEELDSRRERYGYFVLFTNKFDLNKEEVIITYKIRDVVEKGFQALKSDLELVPINHSADRRIETHVVMVILGYLLTSILRMLLIKKGIKYSFESLLSVIKTQNIICGEFEHVRLKNKRLYVKRPIKARDELKKIYAATKIKIPKYEVKEVVTPTGSSM